VAVEEMADLESKVLVALAVVVGLVLVEPSILAAAEAGMLQVAQES
jgi:hypothetical protein